MSDDAPNSQEMTIQQALEQALQHHNAGRFPDAENIYNQILQAEPNHPRVLNLMGVLAHQVGKNDIAVDYFSKAIDSYPDYAEAHYHMAMGLKALGRLDESISSYRKSLSLDPDNVNVHYNFGNLLNQLERFDEAALCYQKAIIRKPDFAEAYNNLGFVMHKLDRQDEALENYQKALQLNPQYADSLNNLGNLLKDMGRERDAVEAFARALVINPDYAEAYSNLGLVLQDLKRFDEAIESHQKALEHMPGSAKAICNLGFAHQENGDLNEAALCYKNVIAIDPNYVLAHNNLGLTYQEMGLFDEAEANYKQGLEVDPESNETRHNLGLLQLLRGQFESGWENYASRWSIKDSSVRLRSYDTPQWGGEDLTGKTIFIYPEQGIGDVIQFARYVPLLKSRGASTILEVPTRIVELIELANLSDTVIGTGGHPSAFDYHIPLLDLPQLLETRLDSVPWDGPYLNVPSEKDQEWADRLNEDKSFRVGIVWGGNPANKNDHNRSIDVSPLQLLAEIPGIGLYSLQVGRPGEAEQAFGDKITDLAPDFINTAAAIQNLDLVITVDTAIAHLAGALGANSWVLLPFIPDWRWMLDRDDSPWYPSIRLFRQQSRGDWNGVIEEVCKELASQTA